MIRKILPVRSIAGIKYSRKTPYRLSSFNNCPQVTNFSCLSYQYDNTHRNKLTNQDWPQTLFGSHRRCWSNGLLDGDVTELQKTAQANELKTIGNLFPQPRVTLNELSSKLPDKVFDIHYKQSVATPKGGRKKNVIQNNDWTCTYVFVWPEKIKFESTSTSKKLAADKAAAQALLYLYQNRRIDRNGLPVYDRDKIEEIKSTLNEPFTASISENSMESVKYIWEEYEERIRDIFEKTHKEAMGRVMNREMSLLKK